MLLRSALLLLVPAAFGMEGESKLMHEEIDAIGLFLHNKDALSEEINGLFGAMLNVLRSADDEREEMAIIAEGMTQNEKEKEINKSEIEDLKAKYRQGVIVEDEASSWYAELEESIWENGQQATCMERNIVLLKRQLELHEHAIKVLGPRALEHLRKCRDEGISLPFPHEVDDYGYFPGDRLAIPVYEADFEWEQEQMANRTSTATVDFTTSGRPAATVVEEFSSEWKVLLVEYDQMNVQPDNNGDWHDAIFRPYCKFPAGKKPGCTLQLEHIDISGFCPTSRKDSAYCFPNLRGQRILRRQVAFQLELACLYRCSMIVIDLGQCPLNHVRQATYGKIYKYYARLFAGRGIQKIVLANYNSDEERLEGGDKVRRR